MHEAPGWQLLVFFSCAKDDPDTSNVLKVEGGWGRQCCWNVMKTGTRKSGWLRDQKLWRLKNSRFPVLPMSEIISCVTTPTSFTRNFYVHCRALETSIEAQSAFRPSCNKSKTFLTAIKRRAKKTNLINDLIQICFLHMIFLFIKFNYNLILVYKLFTVSSMIVARCGCLVLWWKRNFANYRNSKNVDVLSWATIQ